MDTRCDRAVWTGHEYLLGQGSSGVTFEELCNTRTCCILLVLGSTSGSAGVSVPHSPLSTVKVPSRGFQLFLFQSVSSPLRKSHEAVALISIWIRNVNAALPYTRKGPSLWKEKGRKHLCACVLVKHTLCCKRKVISCQNPVRRGVLKMVWHLKRSPCKRQSPGSIFCLIFSSVLQEGQGRLSMMVWYPFTRRFTVASNLPSRWADRPGVGSGAASFLRGLPWTRTRLPSGLGCTL